jgi:predicted transposase/invertase (TIGR01784 family)
MTSTYINILTDFGFKRIFADEKNKDLLIHFLNSIMRFQGIKIKDITYKNTEFVGEYEEDKKVILDLYCTNEKGEHFLIEVQRAEQEFFKKRLLFYASRLVQEQGIKGKKWDYNFKGVYSIAILDFDMPESEEILNSYRILNEKTHTPFLDDFGFVIINLTQFNKQEHQLKSNFEKWLYLLKNLDKLKDIPLKLQQHLFVKLFNLAEYGALSKKEQKAYMESLKKYNDWENVLEFAQKKGYKKAVLKYEELLKEEKKRAEEEKKRAEEEKKRAEQEKQRVIKSIQKMRAMGASDKEIEETLEIKLKEYE